MLCGGSAFGREGPFGAQGKQAPPLQNGRIGLLLRHAVEGAEAEDQVAAGDADYFASGEKLGERVEGTRSFASLKVGTITILLAM